MNDTKPTITFTLKVGALIRGQVRRSIKRYCFERGYGLSIDEDKGLLGSLLMVTLIVPDSDIRQVTDDLEQWIGLYGERKL